MRKIIVILFLIAILGISFSQEVFASCQDFPPCSPKQGCNCKKPIESKRPGSKNPNDCPNPKCYSLVMCSAPPAPPVIIKMTCYETGQTPGQLLCDECGYPMPGVDELSCPQNKRDLNCHKCKTPGQIYQGGGVYTALGCVPTAPSAFVDWLLKATIGLAGGIAFLLILYGGFSILTSSGDPEKLNNGKDIIVSAIAGLLMIVFSVLLLKIIGVDILKIPGFG